MRYYNQSHRWTLARPVAVILAAACLAAAFTDVAPDHRLWFLVAAVAIFAIGVRLHHGRAHFLEIDADRVSQLVAAMQSRGPERAIRP